VEAMMAQRGRKSTLKLVTPGLTGASSRLNPPAILSSTQRLTFIQLAAANTHLTPSDSLPLAAYVQAITQATRLGRTKDIANWERSVRVALALGRSLRLTAQSSTDPQSVARRRRDSTPTSYYDRMDDDSDPNPD
jgi:hypothetical protein